MKLLTLSLFLSLLAANTALCQSVNAPPKDPVPPAELNDDLDPFAAASAITVSPSISAIAPYQAMSVLLAADSLHLWQPSAWDRLKPQEKEATRVASLIAFGIASPQPATATFSLLQAGQRTTPRFWSIADTDQVKSLDPLLILRIRDRRPIPRGADDEGLELSAYLEMLRNVYQTSDAAFRRVAQPLDRSRALHDPKACRAKVFKIDGQLRLLRRYDAPAALRQTVGLEDVYEGWVFNSTLLGNTPVCVLFTSLPRGLKPAEKMEVPVEFVGTYYKLLRYTSSETGHPTREAPLLMGQTIRLLSDDEENEGTEPATNWGRELLPIYLWTLVGLVGLVVVVAYWFRISDGAVQRRLAAARRAEFVPPSPDGVDDSLIE